MKSLCVPSKETLLMAIVLSLGWCCCIVQGRLATQKCEEYTKNYTPSFIACFLEPSKFKFKVYNCNNVVKLIAGGEQARYAEFPHHALLGYPKESNPQDFDYKCSGTLISDQHILTAAHCFSEGDPTIVRLGEYDTTYEAGDEYDSDIGSIRKHPKYDNRRSYDDIALVKLKYPIALSKHIRPACLWETEDRKVKHYIATGFGSNETFNVLLSTVMMKVQLEEFPVEDCVRSFEGHLGMENGILDGQLCIGSIVEGRDTCQGDSGGSLQVVSDPEACSYSVVGIKSTGGLCGIDNSKAIYTKVSHYIDWIEDNVWGANAM